MESGNIMELYECKFEYLNLALGEIYKKYMRMPSFRLSLPYKYEITTSALFESDKFSQMQDGLYLITNIWAYSDEFYGAFTSFKFMLSPIEEVSVYDDGRYDVIKEIPENEDVLILLLVENGIKRTILKRIRNKEVATFYVMGKLLFYELTYPAGTILKDIWWLDCEELKTMDYKKHIEEIKQQIEGYAFPRYISGLIKFSNK
jgi:hypothetical protein